MMEKDFNLLERLAGWAKEMNSFSDYKEGSATEEYKNVCQEVEEVIKTIDEKYQDQIITKINHFENWYFDYLIRYYRNESSCPSVMISGPANFPVKKKERQNAQRDNLWQEYSKLETEKEKILNFKPKLDLNDDKSQKEKEIEELTKFIEDAKLANKYWWKNKNLNGFEGVSKNAAMENLALYLRIYNKEYAETVQPFPSYKLTSLNGKLKRLKENLQKIEDQQKKTEENPEGKQTQEGDGYIIIENTAEDRLQIIFDDIPDEEIRNKLKSNGFRWSPRFKAWQRQLTNNARYALKRVFSI